MVCKLLAPIILKGFLSDFVLLWSCSGEG